MNYSSKIMINKVLFAFFFLAMTQLALSQATQSSLLSCCSYIQVTAVPSQSLPCCIDLIIENPYCKGMKVKVDKTTNSSVESIGPLGFIADQPLVISLCANTGETEISYVVYCQNDLGQPFCFSQTEYFEGSTMFSGTVPVNCCSCPPNIGDFLTLTMTHGDCPDGGCRVRHTLNIPENIRNCFKYLIFENSHTMSSTAPLNIWNGQAQQVISSYDFCLNPFESYSANIILMENQNGGKKCEGKQQTAKCDSLPIKELCMPDCENTPWIQPYFIDYFQSTNCPGCIVRVTYAHRFACGNWQDLQIAKMELLTNQCQNCNMDFIYKDMLTALLSLNRIGFKPGKGDCDITWRIANGGCWAKWSYYLFDHGKIIDTIDVYEPCDKVECCLQPMKVCRDSDNSVTVTPIGSGTYHGDCNMTYKSPVTHEVLKCEPACDWMAQFGGKYKYNPPLNKDNIKEFDYSKAYGISTSFQNDLINIAIRTPHAGEASLHIYDLNGREITYTTSKLISGSNNVGINTGKLISGVYIYTLFIDGIKIYTDKFIITR